MGDCIFCKIANGEIPSATLYEDEEFRVILDLGPASKGTAGCDISAIFHNQRIRDRPWPCCFKTDRSGTQWRHHA